MDLLTCDDGETCRLVHEHSYDSRRASTILCGRLKTLIEQREEIRLYGSKANHDLDTLDHETRDKVIWVKACLACCLYLVRNSLFMLAGLMPSYRVYFTSLHDQSRLPNFISCSCRSSYLQALAISTIWLMILRQHSRTGPKAVTEMCRHVGQTNGRDGTRRLSLRQAHSQQTAFSKAQRNLNARHCENIAAPYLPNPLLFFHLLRPSSL